MKHLITSLAMFAMSTLAAWAAQPFVTFTPEPDAMSLIDNSGSPLPIYVDTRADEAVTIAARSLAADFGRVTGADAPIVTDGPAPHRAIIIGTVGTPTIDRLIKEKRIDGKALKGKREKYLLSVMSNPAPGVDEALVIAGSDRRGAVYGIYELSAQMGVSPWYWWADAAVAPQSAIYVRPGVFTDGEPAVTYRGIFLNDEAPCLTSWVKNHYGTDTGGHEFYADVFELLLRLKANFMWPAMWGWAFYADDPLNSDTARRMGIIMGTSHHEPMGRNHQEWARRGGKSGVWNYNTNQAVLDTFFTEGIERLRPTEDIITIGMRGDGDEAMGTQTDIALMERIVANQRKIISKTTGRPASERPQVWALYKEVLDYYDKGMRVPDDVIMLLCDDNWGNVRRLPDLNAKRPHKGGWGMYYHVDYVGAPRNSKWLNVTPIQNMWEQLTLTAEYGVDRLWVLNVGDLKPMEYPITLFLDMAWDPHRYSADSLLTHTRQWCASIWGDSRADEAARLLNLYCKYAGRVTPEMLDRNTYSLATGEWKSVTDDFLRLEAEALRQYLTLDPQQRDSYQQLILFPIQAMANLYDLYYSQAMNLHLAEQGDPQANLWAQRAEKCFARDAALCRDYNEVMAGGKWRGMMTQKHIGYTSWNDAFPADRLPRLQHVADSIAAGGYTFTAADGAVVIEAEHFHTATPGANVQWTVIPHLGRTLSGVAAMPYNVDPSGAQLTYRMALPEAIDSVKVTFMLKSTLAFKRAEGHRFTAAFGSAEPITINYNGRLNEDPENIYSVYYPTVAARVVETTVTLPVERNADGTATLTLCPIEPGVVFEKIIVDLGGHTKSRLQGLESPHSRPQTDQKHGNLN